MQAVATVEALEGAELRRRPAASLVGRSAARRILTAAVLIGAGVAVYQHRGEVSQAAGMLSHLRAEWVVLAVAAEVGSMMVFARLQRWLLRAGGVDVPLLPMVEITLAGNAMSTSLPGGPAWAATWAFGQLRRRGANRVLAGWVILVAGALSSFAIFVLVAVGSWVAGSQGPVARLRWVTALLAAAPLIAAAAWVAARRSRRVGHILSASWLRLSGRVPGARAAGSAVSRTFDRLALVRPGVAGWAEAFGLACANWVYDAVCLVACIAALGVPVPARGLLVIYGLTQISASLPITPGGIGVVEGSMTALLVAYGTRPASALAVVLLYRIVSFWGLVPVGWGAWFGLEIAHRRGLRRRAHPWASHDHGPLPVPLLPAVGPERVMRPEPCLGCPGAAA